jgi:phenylacetate-CoA ligase
MTPLPPFYQSIMRLRGLFNGTDLPAVLERLHRNESLDKESLWRLQSNKLRNIVKHCYRTVPYYRKTWASCGFAVHDFDGTKGFEKVPTLRRQEINANRDLLISESYRDKQLIELRTSGSTGQPLVLYSDPVADTFDWACKFRGWSWAGFAMGKPYARLWGNQDVIKDNQISLGQVLRQILMRETFLPAFDLGTESAVIYLKKMCRRKLTLLRGYTSSLLELAYLVQKYPDLRPPLEAVIASGEQLLNSDRTVIENAFQCRVFDDYGCIELRSIAHECEEHDGLLVSSENALVEILDDNDQPMKAGEVGELTITTLNRFSMPLIRYRTGDRASLKTEACPSGRPFPLISHVEGRTADLIHTPDGKHLSVHFFTILFEHSRHVREFQIIQTKTDLLRVDIVPEPGFDRREESKLKEKIEAQLGPSMRFHIQLVPSLTRIKGKRRLILQELEE